jgi:beta-N-acetylhexosaminidase
MSWRGAQPPWRSRRIVAAALLLAVGCSHGQPATGALPGPTTGTPPASSAPARPSVPPPALSTPTPRSPACNSAAVIRSWSTARLAAQVVAVPVLDFDLSAVTSEVRAGVGGVLLLGSSPAPADLAVRVRALLAHAPAHLRPLVMADEEGGVVQRLAPLVSPVPSPRLMAARMSPPAVRALAARIGRQMLADGVTVDLAPVADVDGRPGPTLTNPDGTRSFSGDPATAATYAVAFLNGLRDGGVLPVVKHFPGLGGTSANTDVGSASTLPLTQLTTTGLVPFRAAIRAGAPAVMVSNASVPGLTATPSSLASSVIEGLLGRQLSFHGLVVTDSLSAGAVLTAGRTLPHAAVAAIAAGADLVLFGSTLTRHDRELLSATQVRRSYDEVLSALGTAVATGRLSRGRLVAAATAVTRASGTHLCG